MSGDNTNSRRLLGPFNRVEGDLEVSIETQGQVIKKAWVNSPLFRGYEKILQGKDPRDAMVYTPRICGICSVSQSVAAAQALANAQGLKPAPNGTVATNLILATENLADHLSHFYLFFMPDFAREIYKNKPWFNAVSTRFKAQTGEAAKDVLPARAAFLHITGLLAGKWPHSLAIQPGGTTRPVEAQEIIRLMTTIRAFRFFLQNTLFGAELELVGELQSEAELTHFIEQHPQCDFAQFLRIADDLKLNKLGRATDQFLSYGAYHGLKGALFTRGVWQQGKQDFNQQDIREDVSNSWMSPQEQSQHPFQGTTETGSDETGGYSWCKAPRLDQQVMEVGAIARQMVNQHPLIVDLVNSSGANVKSRVVARLLELALVVPAMEQWASDFEVNQGYCETAKIPDEAQGMGLVEAARGSLGHWLSIQKGKIHNYQIIAPTTWNFSPRDAEGVPGALEQALQQTAFENDEQASVLIQHIIRSFDPCMVCTVH